MLDAPDEAAGRASIGELAREMAQGVRSRTS
jgi:tryptophan synthase alpha chain